METNVHPYIEYFDIHRFLRNQGIPFDTEGKNVKAGWINMKCLWCDDRSNHLGINPKTGGISCYRCKDGRGTVIKLVSKILRISPEQALDVIKSYRKAYISPKEEPSFSTKKTRSPKTTLPPNLVPIYPETPRIVQQFLDKRGLSAKELSLKYKVRYATNITPCFSFRLIIPLLINGKIVTFTSRDITGKGTPKYLSLSDEESTIPIKHTLYNIDSVKPGDNVILVEGPVDVWKIGDRAISSLGTLVTQEQINTLYAKRPNRVIILFDNEPSAQKAADKTASKIWFADVEVFTLKHFNDPGELPPNEIRKIREEISGV